MSEKQKYLLGAAFGATILGMVGLAIDIPYSGFILFVGLWGLCEILL